MDAVIGAESAGKPAVWEDFRLALLDSGGSRITGVKVFA